uniref:HTH psq-type domain-containing protein n=1 Tax=Pseudonaja textilis TaxID=8673 RepID=A0A670Z3C1_PSETE
MASAGVEKRKRVNLSVKQKLELIEKLESGWSVARACEEYGVKKQTVSDIRKAKEKLKRFVRIWPQSTRHNNSVRDRTCFVHVFIMVVNGLRDNRYKHINRSKTAGKRYE